MKRIIILLLAVGGTALQAQTNAPAQPAPEPQIEITSTSGHFDGINHQMVYDGNVVVTDAKSKLTCARLTVDLPPEGGRPTNIVAVTNVVIDALDEKGQTNHITAAKAVYTYHATDVATNETITFTGGDPTPKVDNPQFIIYGEPLILNVPTRQFSGQNYRMIFKQVPNSGNGSNASPFNILK